MLNDLAAALNEIIAQAATVAPEPTTEDAFAALLSGTAPDPRPLHPIRDPLTGGIFAFVRDGERP